MCLLYFPIGASVKDIFYILYLIRSIPNCIRRVIESSRNAQNSWNSRILLTFEIPYPSDIQYWYGTHRIMKCAHSYLHPYLYWTSHGYGSSEKKSIREFPLRQQQRVILEHLFQGLGFEHLVGSKKKNGEIHLESSIAVICLFLCFCALSSFFQPTFVVQRLVWAIPKFAPIRYHSIVLKIKSVGIPVQKSRWNTKKANSLDKRRKFYCELRYHATNVDFHFYALITKKSTFHFLNSINKNPKYHIQNLPVQRLSPALWIFWFIQKIL